MPKHRKRFSLTLLVVALALPVGFAASQAIGNDGGEVDPHLQETPEQVHYLAEQKEAAEEAYAAGDEAALDRAAAAIRDVNLSLMDNEEREAYEAATPEAEVPDDTLAFIPDSMPASLVERCEEEVSERGNEPLCELVILHDEGKIRSGAFSPQEVEQALGSSPNLDEGS
jgi:hypothetical protein